MKHDPEIIAVLPEDRDGSPGISTPRAVEALAGMGLFFKHTKTVQRRLEAMERAGLVRCEKRGTTLYWKRKPGISGMAAKAGGLMRFDEALALQALVRFSSRQIPALVSQSLAPLFDVAAAKLSTGHAGQPSPYGSWLSKVSVEPNSFPLQHPTIAQGVFEAVSQALFLQYRLDITYQRRNSNDPRLPGPVTKTMLLPLGLVEVGGLVYLVASRADKPKPTLYRLDRIVAARITEESFSYPTDFSLDEFIKTQRQFDFFPSGTVTVHLRFRGTAGDHLLESPMATDQQAIRVEEGLDVSGTVTLSHRLRWWIRSFGPYVEVLAPADLRAEFVAEARSLSGVYAPR
ncbi:helix-turn-helix transcriptional regulator [Caballeronia concitans]|uniref:Transcriptional regulator n=1 Tax=Caballeronia concitans TaxID=1777133 RepID=A0A658R477_9BURK|nr:WYL domain-containing protein [Caballeronia concitans]SAL49384.1 transcriptional regulator [Caballeronia concitans]